MRWDAAVMADWQLRRINKRDTITPAKACVKVKRQALKNFFLQFNKASVAHQGRKRPAQISADMVLIIVLETAIVALIKTDEYRHDLTGV